MKRLGVALLPLACLLFTFGCQSEDKGKDKDKEKPGAKADIDLIQGSWKIVSSESDGNKEPDAMYKEVVVVIDGKEMRWKLGGQEAPLFPKKKYKLFSAQTPKQIELETIPPEPTEKDDKTERKTKGIYELDGDTLKICTPHGKNEELPTKITAKEGSGQKLMVLKRVS